MTNVIGSATIYGVREVDATTTFRVVEAADDNALSIPAPTADDDAHDVAEEVGR